MTPELASAIRISEADAFELEDMVRNKIRKYIDNFSSSVPLSEEWIKRKGNSEFFKDTGHSYYEIGIRFLTVPVKWNVYAIDANEKFKFASYQMTSRGLRTFLPNEEKAFSSSGTPTDAMVEWVNGLILEAIGEKYGA